jgi:hypothetical protein
VRADRADHARAGPAPYRAPRGQRPCPHRATPAPVPSSDAWMKSDKPFPPRLIAEISATFPPQTHVPVPRDAAPRPPDLPDPTTPSSLLPQLPARMPVPARAPCGRALLSAGARIPRVAWTWFIMPRAWLTKPCARQIEQQEFCVGTTLISTSGSLLLGSFLPSSLSARPAGALSCPWADGFPPSHIALHRALTLTTRFRRRGCRMSGRGVRKLAHGVPPSKGGPSR